MNEFNIMMKGEPGSYLNSIYRRGSLPFRCPYHSSFKIKYAILSFVQFSMPMLQELPTFIQLTLLSRVEQVAFYREYLFSRLSQGPKLVIYQISFLQDSSVLKFPRQHRELQLVIKRVLKKTKHFTLFSLIGLIIIRF